MSYYPLGTPATGTPTRLDALDVVFAGYGISAPDVNYDDYARLNVEGKAVVIFSHEPQERSTSSRLNGARPLPQTTLEAKAAAARDRGAQAADRDRRPDARDRSGRLQPVRPGPRCRRPAEIPVLRIRRKEAQALTDAFLLDARARQIDSDLVPRSGPLQGAKISYTEDLTKNRRTVRNVVGVLPGSDPARRDQAVVIGAHYDHVGIGGRLSVSPERVGQIHNGADDNASGTSAIIEMARVAAADRGRFPRSLVFVAFAGEERGLLGSAHYTTVAADPDRQHLGDAESRHGGPRRRQR